jgi:hypothetical protein
MMTILIMKFNIFFYQFDEITAYNLILYKINEQITPLNIRNLFLLVVASLILWIEIHFSWTSEITRVSLLNNLQYRPMTKTSWSYMFVFTNDIYYINIFILCILFKCNYFSIFNDGKEFNQKMNHQIYGSTVNHLSKLINTCFDRWSLYYFFSKYYLFGHIIFVCWRRWVIIQQHLNIANLPRN